jgi:prepilin-type N-terminal cleavage/methylation domain-containing protein
MSRAPRGFTLVEIAITLVLIGLLAAIAIPNYFAMLDSAKEGSTKANMHDFQLAAEDYGAQNHGAYANTADELAGLLPGAFRNPFDSSVGAGNAWQDNPAFAAHATTQSTHAGVTTYSDSASLEYVINGRGKGRDLGLQLQGGR